MSFLSLSVHAEITADDIYAYANQINEEINILKRHFSVKETKSVKEIKIFVLPRHTWQKSYEILFKLNLFREKQGLPILTVTSREPQKNPPPAIVYEQVLRIITELQIIKFYLGIQEEAPPRSSFSGKTVNDNYNLLNAISAQLDLLNDSSIFTLAIDFGQAMRVTEDIDFLIEALNIKDTTTPPLKEPNTTLENIIETQMQVLAEIQRLQPFAGLEKTEIYGFKPEGIITPYDIFSLMGVILAELQPIKAHLELKYASITARHYENKTPEDIKQVLSWALRKLLLIRRLNQ
jgi:hypothetical protein